MTAPNEPPRDPTIDPSDPGWVEDVLARARRRAEEAHREAKAAAARRPGAPATPSAGPPSTPPVPPVAAAPRADTGLSFSPVGAPAPEPTSPAHLPHTPQSYAPPPTPAPRANPRPRPIEVAPLEDVRRAPVEAPPSSWDTTAAGWAEDPTTVAPQPGSADPYADDRGPADPGRDAELADDDEEDDFFAGEKPPKSRVRSLVEWTGVIVGALLVAFVIRAVAFQAFYIPSESMESTLEVRDRILVNKLSYRLHDVRRGDVVVFEKPPGELSPINDLIKRVIALPGETIEQQGSDLYIDRGEGLQRLTEGYLNDPNNTGPPIMWVQGCANPATETNRCTIPEGHLWVMGDNRGHSHDSRMFGPIDEDLVVGRAFVKVWPLNKIGFL